MAFTGGTCLLEIIRGHLKDYCYFLMWHNKLNLGMSNTNRKHLLYAKKATTVFFFSWQNYKKAEEGWES